MAGSLWNISYIDFHLRPSSSVHICMRHSLARDQADRRLSLHSFSVHAPFLCALILASLSSKPDRLSFALRVAWTL
ncbi:hypothetical protein A0H81_13236 [Grifola frondosa]|uniref:Uncharacterized protein n=1 Tax=Grifola frondosa TaxID=5627 RepID=A0A1C7LQ69_GRIFR|nr:hypothetical protein A0H81_13236 [Grifola frondosa]